LLILFILKAGSTLFTALIILVIFLGLGEFYRMALPGRRAEGWAAACCGSLLPLAFLSTEKLMLPFSLTALLLLFALIILFRLQEIKNAAGEVAVIFTGFLYVALPLGHLILLRSQPAGIQWLLLMMVIVMAGDSAAYYVGTAVGKRRLYPAVSPKKSIEGSIGGLVGSIAGAFLAKVIFFQALTPVDCVATALLLGVLGQLGDLFESLLKRSFGVKDSGTIIPGHGGMLDRLDSIIFATPAAFYYAYFVFK
jgi:phosphatidate cytidylyltransferase